MIPRMPPHEGQLGFLFLPPYRVQGISIAGEQTSLHLPELDVAFDIGQCIRPALSASTIALSHAHMDHLGGLPYWLSQRYFQKLGAGRVICHPELVDPLQTMLKGWVDLERQETPFEIVGLPQGEEVQLKGNITLRSSWAKHTSPALSFLVVERRSKLKEEFNGLPQGEIRRLKASGTEITSNLEIPIVAYTGDTERCEGLESPAFSQARIVVTECTFFAPEHRERARVGRHLHVSDLEDLLEIWNADHIVIVHTSRRTSLAYARDCVHSIANGKHNERVHFLMDHRTNRRRYEAQQEQVNAKVRQTTKPNS